MIKAVIFDMDGTLLDSDAVVKASYRAVFSRYLPSQPLTDDFLNTLLAPSYHEVFSTYIPQVTESLLIESYMKVQHQLRSSLLKLFPQVKEVLLWLKKNHYKIGLVTSEVRHIALDELDLMGIVNLFDLIVTSDDVSLPKPSPEGIFKIITKFHVRPSETLMIGDQRTDWEAARAAQVHLGAVAWSNLGRTEIESYEPEVIIHQWSELPTWLGNFQRQFKQATPSDFVLKAKTNQPFRILQLTDLHLMNGPLDALTFKWIQVAVKTEQPDFIVITGDLTMCGQSVKLYGELKALMDQLQIPWTFTFGNHDTEEGITHDQLIEALQGSTHLLFKKGPQGIRGEGNFSLRLDEENGTPRQLFIFLDSGVDHMYPVQGKKEWGYQRFHFSQVNWVDRLVDYHQKTYPGLKNVLFFHIPIPEYHYANTLYASTLQGDNHEGPSSSKFGSGLWDVLVKHQTTQAMFVGHDHLNDYAFTHEGIMMAFGRVSGHYDYAMPGFPKGARRIEVLPNGILTTKVIFEKDYL